MKDAPLRIAYHRAIRSAVARTLPRVLDHYSSDLWQVAPTDASHEVIFRGRVYLGGLFHPLEAMVERSLCLTLTLRGIGRDQRKEFERVGASMFGEGPIFGHWSRGRASLFTHTSSHDEATLEPRVTQLIECARELLQRLEHDSTPTQLDLPINVPRSLAPTNIASVHKLEPLKSTDSPEQRAGEDARVVDLFAARERLR